MRHSRTWAIATVAALIFVIAALALLLQRRRARLPPPLAAAAPAAVRCEVPPLSIGTAAPGSADPVVVLAAAGKLRFYVDGKPVVADLEQPLTVSVGEHELRVQAEGHEPYVTRFRVGPFTPGMFEAEVSPSQGLSVTRLGTVCTSCPDALDVAKLGSGGTGRSSELLQRAAAALRSEDWREASAALAQVPRKDRRQAAFQRLAGITFAISLGEAQAREAFERAAPKKSTLRAALDTYDRAVKAEAERRSRLVVTRWNRVTERFAAVSQKYEPLARNQVAQASERMVALTSAFEASLEQKNAPAMDEALRAAEETLVQLGTQLRGLKPSDCAFQNEVASTLLQ